MAVSVSWLQNRSCQHHFGLALMLWTAMPSIQSTARLAELLLDLLDHLGSKKLASRGCTFSYCACLALTDRYGISCILGSAANFLSPFETFTIAATTSLADWLHQHRRHRRPHCLHFGMPGLGTRMCPTYNNTNFTNTCYNSA